MSICLTHQDQDDETRFSFLVQEGVKVDHEFSQVDHEINPILDISDIFDMSFESEL